MKTLSLWLSCGVLLGAAGAVTADEAADRLLDRAIRAHGGADNLARARRMLRTDSGTIAVGGGNAEFTEELLVELPERSRHQVTLKGRGARFLAVVNGDRGWQVVGGATQELGKDRLREIRDDLYLLYLTTLTPLRKERRFTVKAVADADVQGKKAAGVRVSCTGHGDVRLYFDRGTGLLVKAVRQTLQAGLPVDKETVYGDHKEFGGVRLPTSIVETVNRNKYLQIHSAKYTFPRVDDRSFAKP